MATTDPFEPGVSGILAAQPRTRLRIDVEPHAEAVVVHVVGALDSSGDELECVLRAVDETGRAAVVDLAELSSADLRGLQPVVRRSAQGVPPVLEHVPARTQRLLDVAVRAATAQQAGQDVRGRVAELRRQTRVAVQTCRVADRDSQRRIGTSLEAIRRTLQVLR